ncbi:MAG: ABC transporter ATP-binding protein [Roseibium sp.]|uniref:ABC transporter ATP-binding protein n=1 Tax=Roseibium sp. TaxID=1936156 RepID=UPI0026242D99|nr:ABC transporter ATP-binding protein [Roseibium sp.]MCV0426436.1 ABC transporter ATP-binding protein [Roseibium sp.]
MADLIVKNLTKRYGGIAAIEDINFTASSGEFLTLLGPSGCGKSTTLAAIAGLDRPSEGRIIAGSTPYFDGSDGTYLPPEARNCGLVFQSYALWPHMTVHQNLEFPLKLRKIPKAERSRRIEEALNLVELDKLSERYPSQLSGGQQQRVALARAIVYQPRILLLDEPLSNLDAQIRDRARQWLKELHIRLGLTTLYVTHDQTEALSLSDRIAVMDKGRLVQLGTPHEIYNKPATSFIAEFIGTSNFLNGQFIRSGDTNIEIRLRDGQSLLIKQPDENKKVGTGDLMAFFRPECVVSVTNSGTTDENVNVLRGKIIDTAYFGDRYQISVCVDDSVVRLYSAAPPHYEYAHFHVPPSALQLVS